MGVDILGIDTVALPPNNLVRKGVSGKDTVSESLKFIRHFVLSAGS